MEERLGLFGGSTHRTVKELINGAECVDDVDCSEYFPGSMMSRGFTDGLRNFERYCSLLNDYLSSPIKQRPEFSGFDGLIFADSGGYKNLTQGGLDGSEFRSNEPMLSVRNATTIRWRYISESRFANSTR